MYTHSIPLMTAEEEYHHENNVISVLVLNTYNKNHNVKNTAVDVFMNKEDLKDVLVLLFVYTEE
jgi:hypothetical protein